MFKPLGRGLRRPLAEIGVYVAYWPLLPEHDQHVRMVNIAAAEFSCSRLSPTVPEALLPEAAKYNLNVHWGRAERL